MTAPETPASPPTPPPAPRPGFARRHWGKLTLLTLFGLPLLALATWTAVAMNYTYSTGTRAGIVQKLSRKGWLCKTWEGELAMTTNPGVAPQIFAFTIRSDSLARALDADLGKGGSFALHYEEHRGIPTSCFGDTHYFVTGYRLVQDAAAGAPAAPPGPPAPAVP